MPVFPRLLLLAALLAAGVALFGCTKRACVKTSPAPTVVLERQGPPPHAPAHGYRHKHPDGVELVFQTGIGVYVVTGYTDIYFYEGHFYRVRKNKCEMSVHIGGPWRKAQVEALPREFRAQTSKHENAKGKGKKV
jgi:hypothetical protein